MIFVHSLSVTLLILVASSLRAEEGSSELLTSCVVEPVFHCVQHLDGGSAVGYFGYNVHCPGADEHASGVFIDIGDDNLFSPGRVDRGQPKVFLPGEHVDEFSVDFSVAEVNGDALIQWTVLNQTVEVDFSRTKDASMDCSVLQ